MNIVIEQREDVQYPRGRDILYPDEIYAELSEMYDRIAPQNSIFSMMRSLFAQAGYDKEHYNTKEWNPLGHLINPGDVVLLKPNLVLDKNQAGFGEDCLYTHPSVVAAMINYVWIALKHQGRIIIADAPVQSCDFNNLLKTSGYQEMVDFFKFKGVNLEILDLRGLTSRTENGVLIQNQNERGGIIVDLAGDSEYANLSEQELSKLRITNYNPQELQQHHNLQKHEYCIAEEILSANVIINMPKPKAHRKAGVTISLKNMVGANVRKEYLPHHRVGDKCHGGDEYSVSSLMLRTNSKLLDWRNMVDTKTHKGLYAILDKCIQLLSIIDKKIFSKQPMREGSWYGNDTIWRTIIDLNKIILYSDKNGIMCNIPQRKMIVCADMIVVGEKEGPLMPSPKHCGMISYSENNVCFDEAIATVMGFDIKKMPLFAHIRNIEKFSLVDKNSSDNRIISNNPAWNQKLAKDLTKDVVLKIEPCADWAGHIELD